MRRVVRRLAWRTLSTDFGNFLLSWAATWPLALYQQYVTRSPWWLCFGTQITLYLCMRRGLPGAAEARRRLIRLDAEERSLGGWQ